MLKNLIRFSFSPAALFQRRALSADVRKRFIESLVAGTSSVNLGQINAALEVSPELASTPPFAWQRTHDVLAQNNFNPDKFLRLIAAHPTLLQKSPSQIQASLNTWRTCQFGEQRTIELLETHPFLFDLKSEERLRKRVTFLRTYVNSLKNVFKLFLQSPNLVTDHERDIKAKMEYLLDVMRMDVAELYKTAVFSHSLDKIRTRHMFLVRLGLFKPRPKKAEENERSGNLHLGKIVDTSDSAFVKLCFLSLEEYQVLEQLYQKEMLEEEDEKNEHSSDEESADESDEEKRR